MKLKKHANGVVREKPLSESMYGDLRYISTHEVHAEQLRRAFTPTVNALAWVHCGKLQTRHWAHGQGRSGPVPYKHAGMRYRNNEADLTDHCRDLLERSRELIKRRVA